MSVAVKIQAVALSREMAMERKPITEHTSTELASRHLPEVDYKFCHRCNQNAVVWGDAACEADGKHYRYSRCLYCGHVLFMESNVAAIVAKLTGRKTPITADKLRRLRELIVASRAQTEQDRKVDGEVMRREYGGGIDGS